MTHLKKFAGLALFATLAACGGSAADDVADPVEDEVRRGLTCPQKLSIQERWEELILESQVPGEIVREDLPAAAVTFFDHVQGSDLVAYKNKVGTATTYAVTWWPNDSDEILGEVAVFSATGARVADGYWKDSPQLYWRGRCN